MGVEVRVPFCDHRLVEYVFNTPWSMKTFDGREKSLLRAAAHGLVPDSILQRRKSPYPATQDPAYELALRSQLANVLTDRSSALKTLFNENALRGLLDKPLNGTSLPSDRGQMDHALTFNAWVQEYDVSLGV